MRMAALAVEVKELKKLLRSHHLKKQKLLEPQKPKILLKPQNRHQPILPQVTVDGGGFKARNAAGT